MDSFESGRLAALAGFLLLTAAFVIGAVINGLRVARGRPRMIGSAIGMAFFGFLALMMAWVTWMAWSGRPLP